jgi:hypothetical protein
VNLNLWALLHVFVLRNSVGDDDRFELGRVETSNRRTREDAMDAECVHLMSTRFDQSATGNRGAIKRSKHSLVRRQTDRSARVRHVVHKYCHLNLSIVSHSQRYSHLVLYCTDQRHLFHLVRSLALFVDQCEVHVQAVSDRRHSARKRIVI